MLCRRDGTGHNRRMPFSIEANDRPVVPARDRVPAWQTRALGRSLEAARTRSVEQMERFLQAARSLADETGSAAFTVPQVAARAGLSLKTFYRCFRGKDDLLLALLEDDSRIGAGLLSAAVEEHREPVARLRAYVDAIFSMVALAGAVGYAGVLVREHRRLSEDYPEELRGALAPMVDLLAREITRAADAGLVRRDDAARDAQTIFGLLLSAIHDVTMGRADPLELAPYVWGFCWAGLHGEATRPEGRGEGPTELSLRH